VTAPIDVGWPAGDARDAPERSAPPRRAWGRAGEFLAVGGATLVVFPLAWIARAALGLDAAELAFGFLTFHAASLVNDPHFAITYLLFYRDAKHRALGAGVSRAQRVRYVLAGVVAPIALSAWAAAAILSGSAPALGWLIQLMFLLVRWHYVKQSFGVLAVLSARRGVRFLPRERAAVLAHCLAAAAFAWARALGGREVEEKGVVYTELARPHALAWVTGAVFAASAAWLVVTLARRRARGDVIPVGPLAALLLSVWTWTAFSSLNPLVVYVIPALHSVQYLYFVWLLKRGEAADGRRDEGFGPSAATRFGLVFLGAIALGWLLLRGAPELLDGGRASRALHALAAGRPLASSLDLGATPWFAAFFAVVNLHHYFMDAVIWRREHAPARALTRSI
jgi:hypothetical protein